MTEADKIMQQWKAKSQATKRAELLADCDTEGLALVLLQLIAKANKLEFDGSLFKPAKPSPTHLASLTYELFGNPAPEGQSKEVQECYAEAYRQGYQFCVDSERNRAHRPDTEEVIFGVDPCELTEDQWLAREDKAAKLRAIGDDYNASKILAMQGDRLTFQA